MSDHGSRHVRVFEPPQQIAHRLKVRIVAGARLLLEGLEAEWSLDQPRLTTTRQPLSG